ncbi:hypothetical protein GCM10022225_80950 [Plantactinospora mayteni]|uniref:Urease accessory protein UreF n=1 Tax=Plantactinospora mayteni TaxID=566021 RepID=A0ABQ4EUY1_9ACTN|nr:urease accessory UreF family protein [Plantactinospora mayteni]GIG98473.1 hypothetical protein Pma05_50460 [Plantactinospora mayteni]
MPEPAAAVTGLATLLVLADGRLPAGGHAHSGGLEAAVTSGRLRDLAGLAAFLHGRLAGTGRVAAAFAAAACAAARPVDDTVRKPAHGGAGSSGGTPGDASADGASGDRADGGASGYDADSGADSPGGTAGDRADGGASGYDADSGADSPAGTAGDRADGGASGYDADGRAGSPGGVAGDRADGGAGLSGGVPSDGGARSRIDALDQGMDARTPSPALRRASRAQGRALLRAGRAMWRVDPAIRNPHHPVALGVVAAAAGLSPAEAAVAGAYGTISGPASAAVRLLGLDPYAVHALLAELAGVCDRLAALAVAGADDPVDRLPADSTPLLEIGAEVHASWEVRLFAS